MIRCITTALFITTLSGNIVAQSFFNTIGMDRKTSKKDTVTCTQPSVIRSESSSKSMNIKDYLSSLTLNDLELLNSKYSKDLKHKQNGKHEADNKMRSREVELSFYQGESRPLSATNLLEVMEEENISNKLFVLAQSLIETGYFRSNACRNYHNLFGLTNPRTGNLYHFSRWEDSVVAYRKFVQYKYKGGSYLSFLKRIGYAEDPGYVYKVARLSKKMSKDFMNVVD